MCARALASSRCGATWWLDRWVLLWDDADAVCAASSDPLDLDVREALDDECGDRPVRWHLLRPPMPKAWPRACAPRRQARPRCPHPAARAGRGRAGGGLRQQHPSPGVGGAGL